MKVYNLIKAFKDCNNFSLNLRDEDDVVWFFGNIQDAMEKSPGWTLNKKIIEFTVVPVHYNTPPTDFIVLANFKG